VYWSSSLSDSAFGDALSQLRRQFPAVPERILRAVLRSYLERDKSLSRATTATQQRIIDACAIR
jgi:hypothetical protein